MKTAHLQSVLARNASFITSTLNQAKQDRLEARQLKAFENQTARIKASRAILYKKAEKAGQVANKLALIQKDIKKELRHQVPKEVLTGDAAAARMLGEGIRAA